MKLEREVGILFYMHAHPVSPTDTIPRYNHAEIWTFTSQNNHTGPV